MSPVIVKTKIFLRELWALNFGWDDKLPDEHSSIWINFRQSLSVLNDIKIQRHVSSGNVPCSMQLHAFSDASEQALGAAIYIRSILQNGLIIVRLLCAKSKAAPKKNVTIPRLELCAARLTANLMHRVKGDLKWNHPCYYWSDSEIVLAWLNTSSSSHYTFVANRIAAIQEISTADQWLHVPSKHNPADLASRGTTPERLKNNSLWWYGPLFLHGHQSSWPLKPSNLTTDLEKRQAKVVLSTITRRISILEGIDHRNSFKYLQRTLAYILRFIKNIGQLPKERKNDQLSVQELDDALLVILREVQQQGFEEDMAHLQGSKHVNANSNLCSLSPFLDETGIIRVGGRLQESELAYDAKHPILLPYGHLVTKLLMTHIHETNSHVGAQALLAITRQKFWPIKGKTIARSIIQNCVRCCKFKPKLFGQFMGNLPAHRVQPSRPFINLGIDFCGPFSIHFKLRGKRPQKCYVSIFCCFSTKAVHIEVVSDLSTDAFVGALKRFVSRRGNCRNIYCDNATNFVGASNQLKEIQQAVYSKNAEGKITQFCTNRGIDFHFIPPRAPHFGGLWEAAVKSAKHLFKKSVASASLTFEELTTIMTEIEAILNSRPLTPMSSNPNDLCALTPGHFLIGEPLTSAVDPNAHSSRTSLLKNWKQISELKNQFWQRWTREYLCELQHRYKWKQRCENVQPGTMVVIKDDNLPPLSWQLGRIVNTIKGPDGLVRVADVKTTSGMLKRPIHKLAPLPIEQEQNISAGVEPSADPNFQNTLPSGNKREEEKETQHGTPAKKSRRAISPISLVLLACLIVPILANSPIQLSPFKTQAGLYFESMGSTHLVTNEWKLIIYYNLESYWKELENIKDGINNLRKICDSTNDTQACTQTVVQFSDTVTELENNNALLTRDSSSRHRRAPLDIVGNLAHSLFGVLDSTYAEKMSQIINDLEGNQQHLLDLLKNQTSIVDSTVNVIKKSSEIMEGRLQEFERHINRTILQLKGINKELQEQRILEIFNALAVRLILATTNYQRMQTMMLDVIIDTHHGKMNPTLLTPKQFRNQLIIIKENLPPTLRLPANQGNLLELYSLMTVEVRVAKTQLIFRVKLPLLSYEPFELLRIVPVPVLVNDSFVIIEPSSQFLIINLHRDQYYPLSEQELAICSTIGHFNHLCKQHHPLFRKGANTSACEIGFLTNSPSLSTCKINKSYNTPRWIQLVSSNHWIYIMKEETTINIVCGNTVVQKSLSGSGVLNISNGCTIKDESTTIQAHNLYPSTLRTSFIPTKNLTELLGTVEIAELWYKPSKHQNISNDIIELKDKLQQLRVAEESTKVITHQDAHQFAIGYIGLFITLIICSYLFWKHLTRQHPARRPLPPIPVARVTRPNNADSQFSLRPETVEMVELNVQRGGGC